MADFAEHVETGTHRKRERGTHNTLCLNAYCVFACLCVLGNIGRFCATFYVFGRVFLLFYSYFGCMLRANRCVFVRVGDRVSNAADTKQFFNVHLFEIFFLKAVLI